MKLEDVNNYQVPVWFCKVLTDELNKEKKI